MGGRPVCVPSRDGPRKRPAHPPGPYLKAWYPFANFGPGYPNFTIAGVQKINSDQVGSKIDHYFENGDRLYGAIYLAQPDRTAATALKTGAQVVKNPGRLLSLSYTRVLSPTLVTTFRYGYNYSSFSSINTPAGEDLAKATHLDRIFPVRNEIPIVARIALAPRLTGTTNTATPFGPNRQHIMSADLQKVSGSHILGAGFMLTHMHIFDDGWNMAVNFDQFPTGATYGTGLNSSNTGDGLASILLNVPSTLAGTIGASEGDSRGWWQGYYIQDTWRPTKRLTMQIGLRYDYIQPFRWKDDVISGWDPNCPCFRVSKPFPPSFPVATARNTWFFPQRNGYQPRLGLAYRAGQRTVIRAGFAKFDDHNNNLVQQTLVMRVKWPAAVGINLGSLNRGIPTTFFDNLPLASSLMPQAGQPGSPSLTFSSDPHNKIPYALLWNFGIQHSFSPALTAQVNYVGSGSRHLYIGYEYNAPLPDKMGPGAVPPRAPFPQLSPFEMSANIGTSNYHSLQLSVEKRLSHGLSFTGSYTWSHCLSFEDTAQSGTTQNPYNLRADYGNCEFDFRHILVLNSIYDLPFGRGRLLGKSWSWPLEGLLGGWRIGGIATAQSGQVFSVTVPFDNANISPISEQQRGDLVGNPLPSGFQQDRFHWYNPAAYVVPKPYTFGNLGRNTLRGPNLRNFDFTAAKDFRMSEAAALQFRAEFFNLLNHPNFGLPNGAVSTPTFLQIVSAGAPRDIQLGLKLRF